MPSSHTWTTSSGELGFLSDTDELNDRTWVVEEYNRLAKKVGWFVSLGHLTLTVLAAQRPVVGG